MSYSQTYVEPGDTIELDGETYECVLGGECIDCELEFHCDRMACSAEERVDEENVIFKKIEQ